MSETSPTSSRELTGLIELLERFKSLSTLSIVLSAFMAFPSNIPSLFNFESPAVGGESTCGPRGSSSLVRKIDRISLLGWADNSAVGDNAEETDDTPLPPALLSRVLDLSSLIPSSIQVRHPRRSQVFTIPIRNTPLRC
jgi:hypothetical protein